MFFYNDAGRQIATFSKKILRNRIFPVTFGKFSSEAFLWKTSRRQLLYQEITTHWDYETLVWVSKWTRTRLIIAYTINVLLDLLWVTHLPQTIWQRFLSSVVCDNLQSICYTQALLSIFLEPTSFKATTLAPPNPYFHWLCMYCKVGM